MNDRIRELAIQAAGEDFQTFGCGMLISQDKIELFAELIVKECIHKITSYDLTPGHSAKWEDIYEIHARLLQDLGDELKEHFGVEE